MGLLRTRGTKGFCLNLVEVCNAKRRKKVGRNAGFISSLRKTVSHGPPSPRCFFLLLPLCLWNSKPMISAHFDAKRSGMALASPRFSKDIDTMLHYLRKFYGCWTRTFQYRRLNQLSRFWYPHTYKPGFPGPHQPVILILLPSVHRLQDAKT